MIEAFESGGPMVPDGGLDDVQSAIESLRSGWAALDGILLGGEEAGWPDVAPVAPPELGVDEVGTRPARDDAISGALTSLAALAVAQPGAIGAAGGDSPVAAGGDTIGGRGPLSGPDMGVAGVVAGRGGVTGGGRELPIGGASGAAVLSALVRSGAAEIAPGPATDLTGMVAGLVVQAGLSGIDGPAVPAAAGGAPGWPRLAPGLLPDDAVSNLTMTGFSMAPGLNATLAGRAPGLAAGGEPLAVGGFAGDAAGPSPAFAALVSAMAQPVQVGAMAQPVQHDGIGLAEAVPVPPGQVAAPADMVLPWSAPVPPLGGNSRPMGPPPDRERDGGAPAHRQGRRESPAQTAADGQAGEAAPIVVHTEVHLDGAVLARAVTDRIVLGMNGPLSGAGGFDGRRSYTPVEG